MLTQTEKEPEKDRQDYSVEHCRAAASFNQIARADAFEPWDLPEARQLVFIWESAAQLSR